MLECVCGRIPVGKPFNRMKDCPKCWLRSRAGLIVASRNVDDSKQRVYVEFPHGLGDCVQFTTVLRHLRKHRPNWSIDVAVIDEGRASIFAGQCDNVYLLTHKPGDEYTMTFRVRFFEHPRLSKVWHCLRTEFNIEPEIDLLRYRLQYEKREPMNQVVLHYQGASSKHNKDLTDGEVKLVIQWLSSLGVKPFVMAWPGGPETKDIAPIIDASRAWVGIDSGPEHVGGATDSPGLIVWTKHHPARFYEPCPNVEHLIPVALRNREFLDAHFKYHEYGNRQEIPNKIIHWLSEKLNSKALNHNLLTSKAYDHNYYQQHKDAGLDYAVYGDWQAEYGQWLLKFLT